jgi:NAD(P)-dependent dehydrogenase (short-subunit alcohol dehydrogenase family)
MTSRQCFSAKEAGGRVLSAKVDVTDLASIDAAVAATEGAFGRLDGLVNNAAGRSIRRAPAMPMCAPPAEW